MKTLIAVCLLVGLASLCEARPVAYWPYDKLTKEADMVIIATPVAVRDTGQKTAFPGIRRDNRPVPAISIETTFSVLAVLKGMEATKRIVLYHLREEPQPEISVNGPGVVSFDPKGKRRYLLFLRLESDGRFSAITGQTDPDGSVKDLGVNP
jgi:hypothetical protein